MQNNPSISTSPLISFIYFFKECALNTFFHIFLQGVHDHLNQEEGKKKKKKNATGMWPCKGKRCLFGSPYKLTSFICDICLLNDVFMCDICYAIRLIVVETHAHCSIL